MQQHKDKKLILFDLDDTLAPSKSSIDEEMAELLAELLALKKVAIMSGASFAQLQSQVLQNLSCGDALLEKLFLFSTNATALFKYEKGAWRSVYAEELRAEEKKKITEALENALLKADLPSEKIYGERIEDRGTQISFSGLGQKAPLVPKRTWDPSGERRRVIAAFLEKNIPEYLVRITGTTTIDITRQGIHKGYGVEQAEKHLGIGRDEMLFMGDSLFPEGNDYSVKEAGVECIAVSGPEDTKQKIREMIASYTF